MPFQCDLCPKSYRYKRNLTRHITEHHSEEREHWNCVVLDCHAKFIRRSYLSKHLTICHGYDSVTARECALNATRGDYRAPTYYDVVSDDDSILDLLAEADGTALDQSFDERIERFNLGQFSPVPQNKGAKCNIRDDVSDVSSVTVSASISTVSADEQDCDLASDVHDGLSGDSDDNMPRDHDNHSDDNMTHDEDNHSDDNVTGYRYITHLYCLAVQAGFYGDVVECWILVRRVAGSILGRVRSEDIFLHLLHLAPNVNNPFVH